MKSYSLYLKHEYKFILWECIGMIASLSPAWALREAGSSLGFTTVLYQDCALRRSGAKEGRDTLPIGQIDDFGDRRRGIHRVERGCEPERGGPRRHRRERLARL